MVAFKCRRFLFQINAVLLNLKEMSKYINVSWAVNQYIRMISEGSCDTEDRSNDDEYSDLVFIK